MKKILIAGGIAVILLALVIGGNWGYKAYKEKQAIDAKTAEIKSIIDILNKPIDAQNIPFASLHAGKNDFNGTVFELFDIKDMKKGEKRNDYPWGTDGCDTGCPSNDYQDYFFSYFGKDLKLEEGIHASGGTAGIDTSYKLFVLNNKTKKWDTISEIDAEEDLQIIGYKDFLIILGGAYHYHGIWDENVFAYNLTEMKVVPTKSFSAGTWGYDWASFINGIENSFYTKNNNLYLRAPLDQCYFLSNLPTYTCSGGCNLESHNDWNSVDYQYVYAGCISGYYPVDVKEISKNQKDIFREEYVKEAARFDMMLRATNWGFLGVATTSQGVYIDKDSEITMVEGTKKKIKDVQVGDMVLEFDPDTFGEDCPRNTKVYVPCKRGATTTVAVAGKNQGNYKMSLVLNNELSIDPNANIFYFKAIDLIEGDSIATGRDDSKPIKSLSYKYGDFEGYNLTLEGKTNYDNGNNPRYDTSYFYYANGYLVPSATVKERNSQKFVYAKNGEPVYSRNWLTPLIGRTLNLALAGDVEQAWQKFRDDFVLLSKEAPLIDPVDPVQVERDLRIMLKKKDLTYTVGQYIDTIAKFIYNTSYGKDSDCYPECYIMELPENMKNYRVDTAEVLSGSCIDPAVQEMGKSFRILRTADSSIKESGESVRVRGIIEKASATSSSIILSCDSSQTSVVKN